jgi:hypothetical protein
MKSKLNMDHIFIDHCILQVDIMELSNICKKMHIFHLKINTTNRRKVWYRKLTFCSCIEYLCEHFEKLALQKQINQLSVSDKSMICVWFGHMDHKDYRNFIVLAVLDHWYDSPWMWKIYSSLVRCPNRKARSTSIAKIYRKFTHSGCYLHFTYRPTFILASSRASVFFFMILCFLHYINVISIGQKLIWVPFSFSPSWIAWTLLMAYSKTKLKSNGDKVPPCSGHSK